MSPINNYTGTLKGEGLDMNESALMVLEKLKQNQDHRLHFIDSRQIVLFQTIGQGAFGRVWAGKWATSSVAVKEFQVAQDALSGGSLMKDSVLADIMGEAAVMSLLRHPKILQMYGYTFTSKAVWIVSELCELGNLRELLDDRKKRLSTRRRLRLAIDIIEGMLYLHTLSPPIIHRDLKSHNIFIKQDSNSQKLEYVAKIGDLGSATAQREQQRRTMTWGVGTACWLAPEVIEQAHYSQKSDVFAFGIVLWEIATRNPVYPEISPQQILYKVPYENLRPIPVQGCPWNHIMEACWAATPDARPTFQELLTLFQSLTLTGSSRRSRHRRLSLASLDQHMLEEKRSISPADRQLQERMSFAQQSTCSDISEQD